MDNLVKPPKNFRNTPSDCGEILPFFVVLLPEQDILSKSRILDPWDLGYIGNGTPKDNLKGRY